MCWKRTNPETPGTSWSHIGSTPVSLTSILLYAKKHGVDYETARNEFLKRFPGSMRPTFMGVHGKIFDRAQRLGYAAPANPTEGALKIPNYYHERMLKATGVPLDTHEIRAIAPRPS